MKQGWITLSFLLLAVFAYALGFEGSRPLSWLCFILGIGFEITFWIRLFGRKSKQPEG